MTQATLSLAAPLAYLLVSSSLYAQEVQPPTAAEAAPSSQEAPLMQMEAPPEHVVAPPPVAASEPGPAPAAAPPPEQAPPPACDQSATPSPCTQPDDAYRHDGFYLRLTNETQYLTFLGDGPNGSASVKGLGSGGMLALGGTPLPGLVIGGMVSTAMLRGSFNGRPQGPETDANIARVMFGVFADWFPQPNDGWHVGAALGFAGISLTDSSLDDAVGAAFSAKLFGGYDWWIGPQWTLGLAAVFSATPSTSLLVDDGDKSGYRFHTLSAGVAGSLTLH